jgi:hypothetical protein
MSQISKFLKQLKRTKKGDKLSFSTIRNGVKMLGAGASRRRHFQNKLGRNRTKIDQPSKTACILK